MKIKRMWINQPSTLQHHHGLHGRNVLADEETQEDVIDVWFTSGDVISMRIHKSALSPGWRPATPTDGRESETLKVLADMVAIIDGGSEPSEWTPEDRAVYDRANALLEKARAGGKS